MGMDATGVTLGNAISTALGVVDPAGKAAWISIAQQIVTYIQSNAVVAATGPDPQGGTVTSAGTVS